MSLNNDAANYRLLFDTMVVDPSKEKICQNASNLIRKGKARYEAVLPMCWQLLGIIHYLEGSCNFATHPHNGDKLTARTVHVPSGRPAKGTPPFTWEQSAKDLCSLKGYDIISIWTPELMLFKLEANNGFGYRRKGINTPYLWSFTNHYKKGKYVADGKYSTEAVSKQVGAAILLKLLL
jgi:lysozyme family protein